MTISEGRLYPAHGLPTGADDGRSPGKRSLVSVPRLLSVAFYLAWGAAQTGLARPSAPHGVCGWMEKVRAVLGYGAKAETGGVFTAVAGKHPCRVRVTGVKQNRSC